MNSILDFLCKKHLEQTDKQPNVSDQHMGPVLLSVVGHVGGTGCCIGSVSSEDHCCAPLCTSTLLV